MLFRSVSQSRYQDGIKGQVARLKVPPAEDIFDTAKREAVEKEQKDLDEFLQMISNQISAETDVDAMLDNMGLAAAVRTRVQEYLHKAEESTKQ